MQRDLSDRNNAKKGQISLDKGESCSYFPEMKSFSLFSILILALLAFLASSTPITSSWRMPAVAYAATEKNLNNLEIGRGLKEALILGVKTAVHKASRLNGFYKNPLIFIPFPPEAKMMKQTLETIGLGNQVKTFVKTLNRAAEEACKKAGPIFLEAIKGLTIQDAYQILRGPNDAATRYLQRKTSRHLERKFRPIVRQAIKKVQVTKYWKPLASRYNQVPFVKKVNPRLDVYVTDRAVDGLFKLMAIEERKIRKDPTARVTDLLRRVFGN